MTESYGVIIESQVNFEHFSLPALKEALTKDRCDCHNLPDTWTYKMLRFGVALKLPLVSTGDKVPKSWIPWASTVWVCLYRVWILQLQSRSAKISLRYSDNDLKVRQRSIIKSWRMPYLTPFPLTLLNKCLDKLSVCIQSWIKEFFSAYWYSRNT